MKEIKQVCVLIFLGAFIISCSSRVFPVEKPNITVLKEKSKYVGDFLGNPNGENGHYIILNYNPQTYISHYTHSEEVGVWRMREDTLFMEPRLYMSAFGNNSEQFVDCSDEYIARRYLITDKYAYDITDYGLINGLDSLFLDSASKEQIVKMNKWRDETREVLLIMQFSRKNKRILRESK